MVKFTHKLLLATIGLLCSLSISAYDFEVDGYRYNILSVADLTVEVVGTPIGRIETNKVLGIKTTEEITLPSNVQYSNKSFRVTKIGKSALENADVKSVIVPEGIETIGERVFYLCENLESITIPSTLSSVEGMAFGNCSKIKKVYISDLASWCNISFNSYWGYDNSNPLVRANDLYLNNELIEECVIPETVTEIKGGVFAGASFHSLSIPNTVTTIGKSAFGGSGILYLELPTSIKKIPDEAFGYCVKLQTVVLPNSITEIGQRTFQNCTSLKAVYLPNNLSGIGKRAFANCNAIEDVYCSRTYPPQMNDDSFGNMTYLNATLHVPQGKGELYGSADGWKNFLTILEDYSSAVEEIHSNRNTPTAIISLGGYVIENPQNGISIIRYSDGTTKKVIIK